MPPSRLQFRLVLMAMAAQLAVFSAGAEAAGPAPQQQPQPAGKPNALAKPPENLHRTPGRIVIVVPPGNLKVAEANEITLRINPPGLTRVDTVQAKYRDPEHTMADQVAGSEQELPVLHRPDGSAYIRLAPMALGELGLRVTGMFSDGEFNWADATLHVGPSDRKPVALSLNDVDLEPVRLDLDDPQWANGAPGRRFLDPEAYYLDFRRPVSIDKFVQYTVRQPAGAPVIDFDASNGSMKPLRRGDALLEASFSGAVTRICIVVRSSRDTFDRGTCRQLHAAASPTPPPSPLNTTWSQDPDGMGNLDLSPQIEFFTERLKVTAPDHPVELGQPLEIPVEVPGGQRLLFNLRQQASGGDNPNMAPNWLKAGPANQPLQCCGAIIVRDNGSSKTIELVPLVLGEEKVAISARFQDGGFSEKYFRLRVLPSAKGLKSFSLSDARTRDGRRLHGHLQYERLLAGIDVFPLQEIKLTVEQPKDAPVVRVDPDGLIHEIRAGDAVIVAEFAGVQTRYPIHVYDAARPKR